MTRGFAAIRCQAGPGALQISRPRVSVSLLGLVFGARPPQQIAHLTLANRRSCSQCMARIAAALKSPIVAAASGISGSQEVRFQVRMVK
jgi:hypothetical protein